MTLADKAAKLGLRVETEPHGAGAGIAGYTVFGAASGSTRAPRPRRMRTWTATAPPWCCEAAHERA